MAGFKGNFKHNMDSNGRVALPAAFRKTLGDTVTLVKGMSEALYVIPEERFDAWVDGCGFFGDEGYRINNPAHEVIMDRIYGDSFDAVIDSAGRINVPAEFRDAAGLSKDVTFVGQRNRIELWDTRVWQDRKSSIPPLKELLPGN